MRGERVGTGRRGFFWPAAVAAVALFAAHVGPVRAADRRDLPPPVVDPHSTEICLNSRLSYHGSWTAAGTDQMLADVLHATALAPVTGATRTIYAATAQNVYVYDPVGHALSVQRVGDWRSDGTAAFEIGVAADVTIDAGAALHLAQLESAALWTGTANQLASCPRASAVTFANSNWNLPQPVDLVTSFGIRSVAGLTTTLLAVSSDGSLPNPDTDGDLFLDTALESLAYDTTFAATDLTLDQLSQLLWAAYGCSNHHASGGRGGLTCASAVANYYLTRRIYAVGPAAVHRFHNRIPPGNDLTTHDHRIELVTAGDVRPALRQAVPRLPGAPHYVIVCVASTGSWQEVEVGFAAVGAVVQASSMGLQGYVTASLSSAEQSAIRAATGIPSGEIPVAIVSLGAPGTGMGVALRPDEREGLALSVERGITFDGRVVIHYELARNAAVELTVRDCQGRRVRTLLASAQARGPHTMIWDGRDDQGRAVLSGVYFCRLKAAGTAGTARVVVVT